MKKITLAQRLRYQFDNTMSKGTIALIGWLFLISAITISFIAMLAVVTDARPAGQEGPASFAEMTWMGLMRTLDSGTMGGDDGGPIFLTLMLVSTFSGIFIVSTLIGVLTSGIESKIDQLRKGRSFVVEEGHTIILGWSSQIYSIIGELIEANKSQKNSCIVILAEKDKVEMEDEIREKIEDTGRTRIVCRTGNPNDPADLNIVNPNGSKSIIILSPEGSHPDSQVIKTMLALTNSSGRRKEPYHIVAEITDPKNIEVAQMVGRNEARIILVGDLISRITVQVCRQAGLSVVYNELLDFGGDEIYFREEPALVGKTFGEALLAYEDSSPIGIRQRDGTVHLNPGMNTRFEPGDQMIAISEDDTTVKLSGLNSLPIDKESIVNKPPKPAQPEQTLIMGWNNRATAIIEELDKYVPAGSSITVVSNDETANEVISTIEKRLSNQSVKTQQGDITDRDLLDTLNLGSYDHIIVLSYSDQLDVQQADASTLITLLHLREIDEQGGHSFSIVSEMLDVRNRQLAEVTRADDFIVSDRLVSLLVSQVAENIHLANVFDDLFDAGGSELYLKPASDYVVTGKPISFYTVIEAARCRGEVAIGYRLVSEANTSQKAYGVHLNPTRSERITLSEKDRIIVLAEG